MAKVFEIIFSSAWNWLGTVVLLVIFTMWSPISIDIKVEGKKHEGDD